MIETYFCLTGEHISSIAIRYIDSRSSVGDKSIRFFPSFVRKTYYRSKIDGQERVKYLQMIYAALASKGVPNVDRLMHSEVCHNTRGSYVDLEPMCQDRGPQSPQDIRNAVMCILETLKVALTSLYLII